MATGLGSSNHVFEELSDWAQLPKEWAFREVARRHMVTTKDPEDLGFEPLSASETVEVDAHCRRQAWVRRFAEDDIVNPRLRA